MYVGEVSPSNLDGIVGKTKDGGFKADLHSGGHSIRLGQSILPDSLGPVGRQKGVVLIAPEIVKGHQF